MTDKRQDSPSPARSPLGYPLGEALRRLELEGYVVFEGLLTLQEIDRLKATFDALPLRQHPYSSLVFYYHDVHFSGSNDAVDLIADPRMLAMIERALGPDIMCMASSYARYLPGYRGMPLHTDSQPYGSSLFGPLSSVPVSLRVFYYLDDLTPERAPLRVVPYSHLSLHQAANPYRRLLKHDEEVALTCPAGSAILINQRLFHAAGPNQSNTDRAVYSMSYRPLWSGPTRRVPAHDRRRIAALPAPVRRLFRPPNTRQVNLRLPIVDKHDPMPRRAPLGPRRWEDG